MSNSISEKDLIIAKVVLGYTMQNNYSSLNKEKKNSHV